MKDFTTELQQHYPSLFYRNDAGELLAPVCGIECPEGWKPLVRCLCAFIDLHSKNYKWIQDPLDHHKQNKVQNNETKIAQIKEKFGSLRFYTDGADDIAYGAIDFAEYLSSKTCEITGESGCLCVKDGWYKTLSLDKARELGFTPVAL